MWCVLSSPVSVGHRRPRPTEHEKCEMQEMRQFLEQHAGAVALVDAHGRVLREDVAAPLDLPQGDNSAMDGYALRAADTPGSLRVIEDIAAGHAPKLRVESGTASRIMTGALMPDGADAVAQVEI